MTAPCKDCDLAAILRDILCQLERIYGLLQPRRTPPLDGELLGKILPAIAGRWGSAAITTKIILSDPAIKALAPGNGALGCLLARAAQDRMDVDGLVVEKVGTEHGAAVWVVLKATSPPCPHPKAVFQSEWMK